MKIKTEDLWKYAAGTKVKIKGINYMYIGNPSYGYELYDYATQLVISAEELLEDVDIVEVLNSAIDLDLLIQIETNRITTLVYEGWTTNTANSLNIQHELDKLEAICKLQKIIKA